MTHRSRTGSAAARRTAGCLAAWLAVCLAPAPAPAQEVEPEAAEAAASTAEEPIAEEPTGWRGTGELSVVATSGNTDTSSVAGRVEAAREWIEGTLRLQAEALRAERTVTDRRAIGGETGDVRILEIESSEVTAENYAAGAEYDRELSERLFAFGRGSWERDEPSGIADRWTLGGGFGHIWAEGEDLESRTTYGATFTREIGTAGRRREFAGLRLAWDHRQPVTPTTTYSHSLVVNENLENTEDLRANLRMSLAVSMTERLALKVSAQIGYDAEPAVELVPLELADGTPAGRSVEVELEEVDTVLSVALVIEF